MLANPPPGTMRTTGGRLEARGECLIVDTPEGTILPVWPPGTRLTASSVTLPNAGWRRPLEIGGGVSLEGRFLFGHDGSLERVAGAAARCAERGFLVASARRLLVAADAAELAAASDAVLLIRVETLDTDAPGGDGFRSTIAGTVLEVLKGPYRRGQPVQVRHVYGAGSPILAHAPQLPGPGEQALLFVSAETYWGQSEARGGTPLPGHVGAGGGLYPVRGGRIVNSGDIAMPETLEELRARIGR